MTKRAITIKAIQLAVAGRYGVSLEDLMSLRRDRHLTRTRMIAMVLCERVTQHTSGVIAHAFGDRDHTTVCHARKVIDKFCQRDSALAGEIDDLERKLRIEGVETLCGLGLDHAAELNAALNEVGLELAIVPIGTRDVNGFARKTGAQR